MPVPAYARRLCDERRLEDAFADPDDADIRLTFGSTIVHVVQHNAQHRDEVLDMLARLGVPDLPEGIPWNGSC